MVEVRPQIAKLLTEYTVDVPQLLSDIEILLDEAGWEIAPKKGN